MHGTILIQKEGVSTAMDEQARKSECKECCVNR